MNKIKILIILVLSLIVSVAYANNSKSLVPILSLLLFDENNVASIEFSASSVSEWEGYEVELSARLVDKNGEYSPISNITCDAGTLTDSTLTLPRVDQDTNVSCYAIAVDSQGKDLSESLLIEVKAISLVASEFQANYAVGRGMIFDYRGPISAVIGEGARLNIQAHSLDVTLFNSQIIAFLPNEYQGNQVFDISIGEHSQNFSVFIEAAPFIELPRDYLSQYIDDLVNSINLSENPELQSLVDDLQSLKISIPTLSELEVQELALYMEQNYGDLDLLENAALATRQKSTFTCTPARKFTAGIIIAAAGAGFTASSLSSGIGSPASVLGLAAVAVGARIAIKNAQAVVGQCVETVAAKLAELLLKKTSSRINKLIGSNTELANSEVGEFRIELQEQIPDSVIRNEFIWLLNQYRGQLIELNSLVGGLLDPVIDSLPTTDESLGFAKSDEVFIKSISDSNVMGTLSHGENDQLNVVFEFIDLAQVPVEIASSSFDVVFGIVDTEFEVPITVKLSVDTSPNLEFSVDDKIISNGSTVLNVTPDRDFVIVKVENNGFLPFELDELDSQSEHFLIETLFADAIQPREFDYFRVRYIGELANDEMTRVTLGSSELDNYSFSFEIQYTNTTCVYRATPNFSYHKICSRYDANGMLIYNQSIEYRGFLSPPNASRQVVDVRIQTPDRDEKAIFVYKQPYLGRSENLLRTDFTDRDVNEISVNPEGNEQYSCDLQEDVIGGGSTDDEFILRVVQLKKTFVPSSISTVFSFPPRTCTIGTSKLCADKIKDSGDWNQCLDMVQARSSIRFPGTCKSVYNHIDSEGNLVECPVED